MVVDSVKICDTCSVCYLLGWPHFAMDGGCGRLGAAAPESWPGTDVRRRPPVADDGGAVVAVDGDAVGLCWDGQWLSGFSGFPL